MDEEFLVLSLYLIRSHVFDELDMEGWLHWTVGYQFVPDLTKNLSLLPHELLAGVFNRKRALQFHCLFIESDSLRALFQCSDPLRRLRLVRNALGIRQA